MEQRLLDNARSAMAERDVLTSMTFLRLAAQLGRAGTDYLEIRPIAPIQPDRRQDGAAYMQRPRFAPSPAFAPAAQAAVLTRPATGRAAVPEARPAQPVTDEPLLLLDGQAQGVGATGEQYKSEVGTRSNPAFHPLEDDAARHNRWEQTAIAEPQDRRLNLEGNNSRYRGARRARRDGTPEWEAPQPGRLKRWMGRVAVTAGGAIAAIAAWGGPVFG